jgi:hypothetical protein
MVKLLWLVTVRYFVGVMATLSQPSLPLRLPLRQYRERVATIRYLAGVQSAPLAPTISSNFLTVCFRWLVTVRQTDLEMAVALPVSRKGQVK